jgi:hypothetical protein
MLAESWGVDGSAPYPMGEYLKGNINDFII